MVNFQLLSYFQCLVDTAIKNLLKIVMIETKKDLPETKMDKATRVYLKMMLQEGIRRKDIIAEFISTCGLTPAGASTYYQKIKKKQAYRNAK